MIRRDKVLAIWQRYGSLTPALVVGVSITLLAVYPAPLLPLARAYQALCEQYPVLALLTFHAPPTPLLLLFSLVSLGVAVGVGAGVVALWQTHRFNQRVRRSAAAPPLRLGRLAVKLGIADRITYLAWVQPAACCYGFRHPYIAITAGLAAQLDDEELIAVLAHERQHLRRRDPVRYLALYALSTAAFMFPVTTALRRRRETRIELAADRAALDVAPRGALAGALLVALKASPVPVPGAAGLSATEARIAHLSGQDLLPGIPARLVVASLGLTVAIMGAVTHLALSAPSANAVEMICKFCTHTL